MSVRTDVINLNVNVNGNQAQNQLNDLKKKAADVKFEMEGLKKGTQAYTDKKNELAQVTTEMANLKKQIGLTSLTQKELVQELNKLKSLKGSVVPFSNEFKELQKQIGAVEARLYDVRNGVQGFASFFSKIKDEVKQFGIAAAAYLGFQFITNQFQNIISGAGKLSDSLADVRKSTGLTAEEVDKLDSSFKKLDTRTTNQSLRDLAVDAGKLGIEGKNAILDFVEAGDQINVALGEDLGRDAVKDIGKLVDIFRTKEEFGLKESMLKVGSAINDVGANSSASEGYIVDFLKRMGGIGPAAKIPLPDLIALAGTMDSLGQTSETSTTAIGNTISKLVTDFDGFAKIAGTTGEKLKQTFNEKGGLAALQAVLEGVKKSGGNFDDLIAKLGDVGIEGAKSKGVFAVLANNLDVLDKQMGVSGKSFEKGISLTNEFNIKNATFGATLDKLGKEFDSLLTSPGIINFLKDAANGAANFIRFIKELPQFLNENRTALIVLTGAVLTYIAAKTKAAQASLLNRLATILEIAADKIDAAQKIVSTAITRAYAFAKGVLTGSINRATAAQQLFNLAAKANPLGLLIIAITAVVAAISFLQKKYAELTAEQRIHSEVQKKVIELTGDEEAKAQSLFKTLQSASLGYEAKKKLLAELIAINPEYLKGLTLENLKTKEGADIMKTYIENLREANREKARQSIIQDKERKVIELEGENEGSRAKVKGSSGSPTAIAVKTFLFGADENVNKIVDNKKQITQLNEELKVLYNDQAKTIEKNVKKVSTATTNIVAGSSARTVKSIKDQIKALEDGYETIDLKEKNALRTNRDNRKKLQAELDALEGKTPKAPTKSKEQKSEESQYATLKKEAAAFANDLKKLNQQVERGELDADSEEIQRVADKYKDLSDRALKYFNAHVTSKQTFDGQEVELEKLKVAELLKLADKRFEKTAAKEYDNSLRLSEEFFIEARDLAGKNYAAGLTDKKQYEASLRDLEERKTNSRVQIAEDYSGTVKKAAADVTKFKKEQEHKTTGNAIRESEKRKEYTDQERLAEAKRKVVESRPGSDNRLTKQKELLQLQFEIETQFADRKSQMYLLKQAELNEQLKDMDKEDNLRKIDEIVQYVNYFQDALQSLNQFITNQENRQLQKDRKINDEKKGNYKKQLDSKLINQAQYDLKVNELDAEQKKKESEARRKQAQREKALNIFNAVINTATAVAKTFAQFGFPLGIPLAAAMAVIGGLQIAAIANTPLPELGKGEWLRQGPKHKDKEKGITVLIERDEAVMSAAAMTDQQAYTVTGTTAQITSALNKKNGGVNWAGGAVIQMPKWRIEKPATINPNMPRIMEQGGVVRPIDKDQPDNFGENAGLLRQILAEQQQTREEIKNWKLNSKSQVVYREIVEAGAKYEASKKASGI